jgi:hypothetical protein
MELLRARQLGIRALCFCPLPQGVELRLLSRRLSVAVLATALACAQAFAQSAPDAAVQRAAAAQKQPLLDTLKELVSIETGSRDFEGLTRATELVGGKLRALGAQVDFPEPAEATTYAWPTRPRRSGAWCAGPSRAPAASASC